MKTIRIQLHTVWPNGTNRIIDSVFTFPNKLSAESMLAAHQIRNWVASNKH